MKFFKVAGSLKVCFTAQELLTILITDFFKKLAIKAKEKPTTYGELSEYVKVLADKSVDSREYEYYAAILDLYEQFNRDCSFCFNLKDTVNHQVDTIRTFGDLERYRDDPPDVIVLQKGKFADFELKRYRDEVSAAKLFEFIKKKILVHYSGKSNYLIIMQPKPNSSIDKVELKKLHEQLMQERGIPGVIGISLNNDNKEMLLIQIAPELRISKREFKSEVNQYADILHTQ